MPLSGTTNATPILCYKCHKKLPLSSQGRKEGQTSSQHGPYALGYTHVTMDSNNEFSQTVMLSKSLKSVLSGDCSLKPDYMNAELVVIAGQLYCGEYVLASCTHRPSSQQSRFDLNLAVRREKMGSAMRVKS